MMWPPPPPPVQAETFIALRARRESHRVMRALLHPPLDPYQFYCRHCGAPLDNRDLDAADGIRCGACGGRSYIPTSAIDELRRRRVRRWGRPPRAPLRDVAIIVYVVIAIMLAFAAL